MYYQASGKEQHTLFHIYWICWAPGSLRDVSSFWFWIMPGFDVLWLDTDTVRTSGMVDQQTTLLTNEAQVEIWWTCWAPMQQGCAEWSDTSLGAQHAGRFRLWTTLQLRLLGVCPTNLFIILIINFSITIQRSQGTLTIQARLSFLKHWAGAGLARPWDVVLHWGEEVFSCKKAIILWHGSLSTLKLWKGFQNMWPSKVFALHWQADSLNCVNSGVFFMRMLRHVYDLPYHLWSFRWNVDVRQALHPRFKDILDTGHLPKQLTGH